MTGLIGHLVVAKSQYSDLVHVVRRTVPLTVASELLWQLLPPRTFACDRLVVLPTELGNGLTRNRMILK